VKRILVALDGSARAPQVLQAAVRLADMSGSKLLLYRAIGIPYHLPREVLLSDESSVQDVLVRLARSDLERLAETAPPAMLEGILTSLAIPWDGICTLAKERDVDLIVIGSHGYGGLDRLIGTVAAKVVNHADRNVLVVRSTL
jgi:nucleotide-binding universal stress UspA family protein